MKKPRKKQRLKELIVREIKRYLDDPDTIEAVIALNYKNGTKTVNFNEMECALSQRASVPGSDLEILSPPKPLKSQGFQGFFFAVLPFFCIKPLSVSSAG